ncbi:amidohydrolase family protein [Amycolatopsis pithecellobii]|uniref:Amidohydrolase family protein n=1 Tax=Amycolatopsis pithecellobii TaxID=664692 RepID=A0A6N7YS11_9PSEU|nr:amidohydrolase family protein [Amycolatopsis pithecellobii]MTD54718.1 amidohydrolase family protein [Amycolatopsis pithecellobii]
MTKTLLRGGTVVPVDPAQAESAVCDVLVDNGVIAAMGPDIVVDPAACEVLDMNGRVLTPGFVDTHRHLWQSLFRYAGADWTIENYVRDMWGKLGPSYTAEDMYVALRIGLAEALDGGCTQIFDWNHNHLTPEHSDAAVAAHRDSGARSILGYGQSMTVLSEFLETGPGAGRTPPSDDIRRLREQYYPSDDQLTRLAMAARGGEVATEEVIAAEARQARELGLRTSIHVGNANWAKVGPVEKQRSAAGLTPDTTWVHCNSLSDRELALIAESGGTVSVAPELELHMAIGPIAIRRLLALGIRPSLSVDTCFNISGEMFSVMRAALSSVRGEVNAAAIASGSNPLSLPLSTRDVLRFATMEGARANGLLDRTGTLEVGKEADIVALDARSANLAPVSYPTGSVVMGANPGNVELVMVRGRIVKRDFALVDTDLDALADRARHCHDRLLTRIGSRFAEGLLVARD